MDDLIRQLTNEAPVAVWVNGLGWNVHCIVLTGYGPEGFYYNDPWTSGKNISITYSDFYDSWNNPIYDGHYEVYYPPRKAISYKVPEIMRFTHERSGGGFMAYAAAQ